MTLIIETGAGLENAESYSNAGFLRSQTRKHHES
jgi:hypothetical protein